MVLFYIIIVNFIFNACSFAGDFSIKDDSLSSAGRIRQRLVERKVGRQKNVSFSAKEQLGRKVKLIKKEIKDSTLFSDSKKPSTGCLIPKVSKKRKLPSTHLPPHLRKKLYGLQKSYVNGNLSGLSPNSKQVCLAIRQQIAPKGEIVNPTVLQYINEEKKIYSPFARRYLKRQKIAAALKSEEVESLPAIAFSEYDVLPPETAEEKKARKEREQEFFRTLNKLDLINCTNWEEREATIWRPYWEYIKVEKEKVLQKQRKKIRPEELETVALKVPLETYKRFKYSNEENTDEETDEDKKIEDSQNYFYYHPDFLDFSLRDGQGRTNLQRLKQNLNPIGKDGYSMEVHHLTMFNESILVLVSRTLHEGISLKNLTLDDKANLHPQPAYYGHSGRSDIDRSYFKNVLKKIFQKLVEKADISRPSLPPVKRKLNF